MRNGITGFTFGTEDDDDASPLSGTTGKGPVPLFHTNTGVALLVLLALGFLWLTGRLFAGFSIST